MGITPAMVGGAVSLGSGLAGLFGANQPSAPAAAYQPQSLAGADQGAISGTSALSGLNTAASSLPYATQTFQNLYNNPYAQQYQSGANALAPVATAAGAQQIGAGSNLTAAGQSYR